MTDVATTTHGPASAERQTEATWVAALALCVLAVAAVGTGAPPWLRLPMLLLFFLLAPGAALLCHLSAGRGVHRLAMMVISSLTIWAGSAVLMAWLPGWNPHVLFGALVVASLASLLAHRATTVHRQGPGRRSPSTSVPLLATSALTTALRATPALVASLAPPLLAVLLWISALRDVDVAEVGQFGLLPQLPPAYYVALALTLCSALLQLRSARRLSLATHVVVLVLILHATVPALLPQAQYGWTYKHVGVVEFISANGALTPDVDIYQQWPAFFSALAVLSDLSGVGSLEYAKWAPVVFNLLNAVMLAAACRALRPSDPQLPWLAVLVFLCASWVGQDYLAPQAFAFTLSLGLHVILLRHLRADMPWSSPRGRWSRLLSYAHRGAEATTPGPPATAAVLAAYAVFAVLVSSHQLTPYIVIAGVAGLTLLRLVGPRHLLAGLVVLAVLYLLPRWGFLTERFQIFSGFDVLSNAESNIRGTGSEGSRFTSTVVRLLSLTVWGAAGAAALLHWRRPGSVIVPFVLFAAPFALFLGQSYGGEGVFRVYLAAVPWAAVLVSVAVLRWARSPLRAVALAPVLVLLAVATAQGLYGQLQVNRISTEEVRASQYLYDNAREDSVLVLASHTFPTRLAANYPLLMREGSQADGNVTDTDRFDGRLLGSDDLPEVEAVVDGYGADTAYLVVSRSMRAFTEYFGLLPPGSLTGLEQALEDSPDWELFFRNTDTAIFERSVDASGANR